MEGSQLLEEGITPFASFCGGESLSSVREAILVSLGPWPFGGKDTVGKKNFCFPGMKVWTERPGRRKQW